MTVFLAGAAGQQEPIPRLETGGPTSPVQALVFSPDGKTLYEAGFDKVVRVWSVEAGTGKLVREARTYRVPVGPGFDGAINALALSPDGHWLAAGGLGAVRGRAGFHQIGVIGSSQSMSDAMREDEGAIHLFHTQRPEQRRLRGHRGAVLALAFAPAQAGKPTLLVSAALERQKDGSDLAVLRLWDCERQEQLAQTQFRPRHRGRQELAVWHTGPDARQLSAAVVWGDDAFRVWEATRAEPWQQPSAFAYAVAHLPGVDRLAVATHGASRGQLEFWTATPGAAPRPDRQPLAFPEGHFPVAARLLPGPAGDGWGRAAVVVRGRKQEEPTLLHTLDLSPSAPKVIQDTITLFKRAYSPPALAVPPGRRLAAVAGAPDHALRVLLLAPGKQGEPAAPQVVASPGRHFPHVVFARKGDARGLVLRAEPRPKPGQLPPVLTGRDLVFDIGQRAFAADRAEWKLESPAAAGWALDVQAQPAADPRLITWTARASQGGAGQGRGVRLEAVRAVTDYALRPPDGLVKTPLLAVAQLDRDGQPLLALYNAETGEEVRHLTGHLAAVRSLAFSGDGRFLVSSGEDQTVCVWSLTNLPNHLGRRGGLPGVTPREEGGKLLVAQAAAPIKLKADQVIEGFVEKDKLRPVTTTSQFLDYLLLRRPGEMVTLRLGGGQGDVQVRVGQAVDEWKPLFTLFVSQTGKPGSPEWIAWNPVGPYDVSDREAERFLGWHFNPAKPDAAVSFAAAAQYRDQRYRRGILKHLLAEGSLSGALAAWDKEDRARKLPEANLRLWLNDNVGLDPRKADGQGQFLVDQPPAKLSVIVDDLPADRIGSVLWQVEGLTPAPTPFAEIGRRTLTADLSSLKWTRGTHRVRVLVRTNDDEPQLVTRELLVRYQPEPPKEKPSPAPLPAIVLEAPERLEYFEGDPAEVVLTGRFVQTGEARPLTAALLVNNEERQKITATDAWTAKVTLVPGTNRIQVRLRTAEGAEAASEAIQLRYLIPPRILKVEGEPASAKPLSGKLVAHVRSALELDPQSLDAEVNGQGVSVTAAVVKKEKDEWEVYLDEVPLREGDNTLRLWVRNADARSREPAVWKVRYTPPPKPVLPPEIVLLEPARDVNWTARVLPLRFRVQSAAALKSVVLTREGRPPLRQAFDASKLPAGAELHLRLRLTPAQEPGKEAAVDLAGAKQDAAGMREITLPWVLLPGLNRFRLEATNAGGVQSVEWVVNYLHQPVQWTLTRLVPRGKGDPVDLPADPSTAVKAPAARGTLHGLLTWEEDRPDLFAPESELRVRVNGLRLPSVRLTPAQAKDRRLAFELPVVLPRAADNFVEVELVGVKADGARRTFRVSCAETEKQPQRMHVLIIRHGDHEAEALRQRVKEALQPDPGCELVFHGPFTGTVRRGRVLDELLVIKQQMDLRVRDGFINNVLVVYYEGAEAVSPLGHFFPSSLKPTELELRRHALTCDSVADYLAEMAGAQVLLLDVARSAGRSTLPGEDRVIHWPQEIRPGVLRYRLTTDGPPKGEGNLLMRDLARTKPADADLQGVAALIAKNFREVEPEKSAEIPPVRYGGSARGHAQAGGLPLLYDWQFPASYATLRVGRGP